MKVIKFGGTSVGTVQRIKDVAHLVANAGKNIVVLSASAETGVQYHVIAPHVGIFPSMALDFYVEPAASIKIQGQDYLTKNWTIKSKVKEQKIYQSNF